MKAYAVNVTNVWKAKSSPGRSKFAFKKTNSTLDLMGSRGKPDNLDFIWKRHFIL